MVRAELGEQPISNAILRGCGGILFRADAAAGLFPVVTEPIVMSPVVPGRPVPGLGFARAVFGLLAAVAVFVAGLPVGTARMSRILSGSRFPRRIGNRLELGLGQVIAIDHIRRIQSVELAGESTQVIA